MRTKLFLLVVALLLAACAPPRIEEIEEFTPVPGPEVGRPAPHIDWEFESGEKGKLSDFQGKVVLLVFWRPDCPHCVNEMPTLKALDERYGEDLTVVSVTTDTSGAWQKVVAEVGFDFLVLVNPGGEISREYQVRGVPTLFVIDREGVIRAKFVGATTESQIEDVLAPLLER